MYDRKPITSIENKKPTEEGNISLELPKFSNEEKKDYSEYLKKEKYITDYILYKDEKNLNNINLDKFSGRAKEDIKFILYMLNAPILIDEIEDNKLYNNDGKIKLERDERQDKRNELVGTKYYDFYESNKLQSSNITLTLGYIDALGFCAGNEGLKTEREELKALMVGDGNNAAYNYKAKLNNKEKLQVVKKFEKFLENVIVYMVAKNS